MKNHFAIFIIFSFFFLSCTQTEKKQDTAANSTPKNTAQEVVEKLPSISVEIMQHLFDKCDYVDYLFYSTDFSMSMTNKGSIQQTLTHISQDIPTIDPNCKAIGRVFYEIDGNTDIEAEIFFSDNCQYFIFMKDNKRLYANNLTPDGIAHFNNIFAQAKKMTK